MHNRNVPNQEDNMPVPRQLSGWAENLYNKAGVIMDHINKDLQSRDISEETYSQRTRLSSANREKAFKFKILTQVHVKLQLDFRVTVRYCPQTQAIFSIKTKLIINTNILKVV